MARDLQHRTQIPFCLIDPHWAQIPDCPMDQLVGLFRGCEVFYIPQLSFFSSPKHFTGWMLKYFLGRCGIWVFITSGWGRTTWLFPSARALLLTAHGLSEGSTSSVSPGQRRAPCQWITAYGLLVDTSSSDTSEHHVWGADSSSSLFPRWLSPNTSACWPQMFPYWLLQIPL